MKQRLDEVFSIYVRRRDCPDGAGRCISCGRPITFETCDAGHYIPRRHTATRWNEQNVHAQCRLCNRMKDGNQQAYRAALVRKFGSDAVGRLERAKNDTVFITASDYVNLIGYFTRKTKKYGKTE